MRLPSPGDVFEERFRIEGELGEGAFAVVYQARDLGAGRLVALKLLKPDQQGGYASRTSARFEREVQIIAQLRDEHTVSLFNYGTSSQGLLYMVFEHVAGEDLSSVLRARGRFAPSEVEHLLRQLLAALAEAHSHGLIHRDVKPQNVRVYLRDPDPLAVKLLDFGIARATDNGHPSITATGEVIGTPRYMSPEQLLDEPLTPASDIYSLGMVAFELLAGADALAGSTLPDQIERLRTGHELSGVAGRNLDPRLVDVIRRMTARDPEARLSSAQSVLSLLAQQSAPHAPSPVAAPPRHVPAATEVRQATASGTPLLVALGLALAGVGVAFVLVFGGEQGSEPEAPPALQRELTPGLIRSHTPPPPKPVTIEVDAGPARPAPIAAVGAVASPGCAHIADPPLGTLSNLPMKRSAAHDARVPQPLIILLHTDHQTGPSFLAATGYAERTDGAALIVAPNDATAIGGFRVWRDAEADLKQIRRLRDMLFEEECIDTARVFVVGNGDGARMATRLSCEPWVAAVAIHGYSPSTTFHACVRPGSILWLHPTASPNIPLNGSKNCSGNRKLTPQQVEAAFRGRNGCEAGDAVTTEHESGTCKSWDCEHAPFQMCMLDGGGAWEGTSGLGGTDFLNDCPRDTASRFPTNDEVWKFFMNAEPLEDPP